MNADRQFEALLNALDDVVDLERGLADAMLSRTHAELVAGLDDALDVEAGLARVVSPSPGLPPRVLDRFITFARELSELPAAERLATRAWLPVSSLVEAYVLAKHVPTVRAVADLLDDTENSVDVRRSARREVRLLIHDLDRADLRSTKVGRAARVLLDSLMARSTLLAGLHMLSLKLRSIVAVRLVRLLVEIDGIAPCYGIAEHVHDSLVDFAFADALLEPLSRLVSALTDVAGADLASADLSGVPLDGVRWSPDTRWPDAWQEWVRDNSISVSADVFEIRSGKAGSSVPM